MSLAESISVQASIDRGTKTYTSGGQSGAKVKFEIAIDPTNAMFFPSATRGLDPDPDNWNESDLLQNIDKVQLKPIGWSSGLGASPSDGPLGGTLNATATVTVSD